MSADAGDAMKRTAEVHPINVLLGLDADSLAVRQQLVKVAHVLYAATLGITHPHGTTLNERLRSPRVGDYVFEVGLPHLANPTQEQIAHGSGYLLRVTDEPAYGPDEWDEASEGRPMPTDDVWYIQYGPVTEAENPDNPDVARWRNCTFVMVPLDGDPSRLP